MSDDDYRPAGCLGFMLIAMCLVALLGAFHVFTRFVTTDQQAVEPKKVPAAAPEPQVER